MGLRQFWDRIGKFPRRLCHNTALRRTIRSEQTMDFFISTAWAQTGGASNPILQFLPLIIIFVLFYFLLIRPQSKRAKEHRQMVSELANGQEVVTGGGLLGKITKVGDTWVTVEVADGVSLKVQRNTISGVMPPGTVKNA